MDAGNDTGNVAHRLLTVREVAEVMRVSTMTVYRLIRAGDLAAIRVGKHFRIREHDLARYLETHTVRAHTGRANTGGANTGAGGGPWPAA